MEPFLNTVLSIADNPLALFPALFITAFINTFFPPVPIEVIIVFCGYLASEGHGSLWVVVSAVTLGMFAGSILFYHIAKRHGTELLKKPFFARFLNADGLNRTRNWMERYGVISLFVSKFVPGVYFCAVISSGLLAVKESKIYPAFFLANLAAFTLLAFIGKAAGERWRRVYEVLGKTGAVIVAAALLLGAVIYLILKYSSKTPPKTA